MHVAAANPVSVEREDVDQEVIDREMRLYKEQAQESGKPEAVIEKIIQGKIEKYYSEVTLMEQTFVKNPDVTIKEHIMEVSGKLGENMN